MTRIDSPDELINLMKAQKINNVLIGNGFCLAHPELNSCFVWDLHDALSASWNEMLPQESTMCPETDLKKIRLNITKKILKFYISKLSERILPDSQDLKGLYNKYKDNINYSSQEFLTSLTNKGTIFTLNYDPLMYFEILKNKQYFIDGFIMGKDIGTKDDCLKTYYNSDTSIKEFRKQKYITCKIKKDLSNNTRVLYLHGSWFFQANEYDELRKLRFGSSSNDNIESLFENKRRPFIILEDRPQTKKVILQADPYLKYCYKELSKIREKLLIFGCSFTNDQHILDAISRNKNLSKIFVTYLPNSNQADFKDKFKKFRKPIEYLEISDNVIWKKLT